MKKFFAPVTLVAFALSLTLLFPSSALAQTKKTSPKTTKKANPFSKKSAKNNPRIPIRKPSLPSLDQIESLTNKLGPLLDEAKKLGIMGKAPQKMTAIKTLKMAVSPAQGTYYFVRHDIRHLSQFFKDMQNLKHMDRNSQAAVALRGMKIMVHSVDAIVTGRLTIKVSVSFVKNVRKYWHLGAIKAITIAAGKTATVSMPAVRAYIKWAKYSYQLKLILRYLEKNYGKLREKADKFFKEANKILRNRFPQTTPRKSSKKRWQ